MTDADKAKAGIAKVSKGEAVCEFPDGFAVCGEKTDAHALQARRGRRRGRLARRRRHLPVGRRGSRRQRRAAHLVRPGEGARGGTRLARPGSVACRRRRSATR
nr:hypothetical protein [Angustibacter aerolatus]